MTTSRPERERESEKYVSVEFSKVASPESEQRAFISLARRVTASLIKIQFVVLFASMPPIGAPDTFFR